MTTRSRSRLWIALAMLVAACGLGRPDGVELASLEAEIRDRAHDAEPGGTISLQDVAADLDWSAMVIVGPYPDGDEFKRVAGFRWNVTAAGSSADETNVVAFVKASKVVAWGVLRGDVYFLPEEDTSLLVNKEDATFTVVVEDDGESLRLDPATGDRASHGSP